MRTFVLQAHKSPVGVHPVVLSLVLNEAVRGEALDSGSPTRIPLARIEREVPAGWLSSVDEASGEVTDALTEMVEALLPPARQFRSLLPCTIAVQVDDGPLAGLPWERLVPWNMKLACQEDLAFHRSWSPPQRDASELWGLPEAVESPKHSVLPLRLLIVHASEGTDREKLLAEEQILAVKKAFVSVWPAVIIRVRRPTEVEEISRELGAFRPHIVHWIGEGYPPDKNEPDARLALRQPTQKPASDYRAQGEEVVQLAPDDLLDCFEKYVPSLVFFNACHSAPPPGHPDGSGPARQLLLEGAASVLCYRGEMPPVQACEFVEVFYEALAHGADVEGAVRAGRRHLRSNKTEPEAWARPVLLVAGVPGDPQTVLPALPPPHAPVLRSLRDPEATHPLVDRTSLRVDWADKYDCPLAVDGRETARVLVLEPEFGVGAGQIASRNDHQVGVSWALVGLLRDSALRNRRVHFVDCRVHELQISPETGPVKQCSGKLQALWAGLFPETPFPAVGLRKSSELDPEAMEEFIMGYRDALLERLLADSSGDPRPVVIGIDHFEVTEPDREWLLKELFGPIVSCRELDVRFLIATRLKSDPSRELQASKPDVLVSGRYQNRASAAVTFGAPGETAESWEAIRVPLPAEVTGEAILEERLLLEFAKPPRGAGELREAREGIANLSRFYTRPWNSERIELRKLRKLLDIAVAAAEPDYWPFISRGNPSH